MQASVTDIKSRLISTFIRLYLIYKTKFLNMYTYFRTHYITNIDNIRGIDTFNKQRNLMFRLLLISIINKAISYLNWVKRLCDVPCKIIESTNNYYDKIDTILQTPLNSESSVSLLSIEMPLQNTSLPNEEPTFEKKIKSRIFSQFNLVEPENENSTCLKNYLIKYRDDAGIHDHTLNNILLINKYHDKIISEGTILDISYFECAKKKVIQLPYHKVKDYHINYFYNSDFLD